MTIRHVRNNIVALKFFTFLDALYPMSILAVVWFYKITGSYTLAATMFAIQIISQALFEVPTGIISDKLGRVLNIRISALLWFLSYLTTAFAGISTEGTVMLIIAALIGGLAGSLNSGTKEALIYETLADGRKKDKFDVAFSRIMMFEQIGAMCGAGIAATVMFFANLSTLAWLTALIGLLFLISSFFLREPTATQNSQSTSLKHFWIAAREIWNDKKLRAIVGIKMLDGSGAYSLEGAYFATLLPLPLVPFARAFRQFTGAIGFYIAPFVRRFGFLKILMFSSIASMLLKFLGISLNNIATPFLNSATNIFYGLDMTASNSLMQESFTNHQRATMKSIQSFLASISEGALLLVFGAIADFWSVRMAIAVTLVIDVIVATCYWKLFKKYNK